MLATVKEIAAKFGIHATLLEPVKSAGFSGAGVWRIASAQGKSYSVKRLTNCAPDHLAWVHRVQLHTIVCDCDFIARPQLTVDGMSFIRDQGGLWEVSTWMPGTADYTARPSDARLSHAMRSLAKFHQSAAQVNFDFRPSPGVKTRLDQLAKLKRTIAMIHSTPAQYPALRTTLRQLKQLPQDHLLRWADAIASFEHQTLPLQPVIRDLRHDHLLFTEDRLTGLIDFDALQMETIAMDLTRCLGSIVPDDADRWDLALHAYSGVRPIQTLERELIGILDPINVVLSALNWIQWIVIDRRRFENKSAVETRLQQLNHRLSIIGQHR